MIYKTSADGLGGPADCWMRKYLYLMGAGKSEGAAFLERANLYLNA